MILLPVVWIFAAWLAAVVLVVEKPLPQADVIYVFSGGAAFVERTGKAAEIFLQGRANRIVLTNDGFKGGWSRKDARNPFFWELAQRELIKQGVPAEAITVLPPLVESTRDEAVLLAATARTENWQSILLVTSPYHTRRALWTTETALAQSNQSLQIGIETTPIGASANAPNAVWWWLAPKGWSAVAGEYLKFGYYWLFY